MPTRTITREALHERAVQDIAKARFAFPNERYPYYKTYVNHPERTMGVRTERGRVVYPDIVVVQDPENIVQMLGEVETTETVNEDEAHEWKLFAELAPLYLYVPVGLAEEAQRLCKKLHIPVVGIRTWRYITGMDEIEINDFFTQWTGPEDLAPGPLSSILKKLL